jgi:glycosyltransferase involved in cell wall biosynthesis
MTPPHQTAPHGSAALPILLCLSHLRWDFVFQRPQHLMTRACAQYRVVLVEEPVRQGAQPPRMGVRLSAEGVSVATPVLPESLGEGAAEAAQRTLLDALLDGMGERPDVIWYYSPMFLAVAGHLDAPVLVYDCMDELSLFRGASSRLQRLEAALFSRADLVFCGGRSLHEAKRGCHPSVHLFPSSIDAAHFRPARAPAPDTSAPPAASAPALADPADQAALRRPRIGYFGVIDERIDLALVEAVATLRPDWEIVMLGPLAKLEPSALPQRPNLHWLGGRRYAELPSYLAHWDAGLMPFALNEATRFISPTKTPEFLAAGVPVVSTPVADVVRDWGERDAGGSTLVRIAADAAAVVAALQATLAEPRAPWLVRVDARLARMSWDMTWQAMLAEIRTARDATQLSPARPDGAAPGASAGSPNATGGFPASGPPSLPGSSSLSVKDVAHV